MKPVDSPSVLKGFYSLLRRDLRLAFRKPGELLNPLLFCLMVVVLFPLGIGPNTEFLAMISPGVVWVIALLACLLSTDRLFKEELDDGSLEQFLVSPYPLYFIALAKVIAYWLITGVPIALISPLIGLMLHMPSAGMLPLVLTLFIGTGVMSLLGAVGAALTVGLRRGGVLLPLLVLPMYVPILIFGAMAVQSGIEGYDVLSYLAILLALLLLGLTLAPLAISAALRVSCDN